MSSFSSSLYAEMLFEVQKGMRKRNKKKNQMKKLRLLTPHKTKVTNISIVASSVHQQAATPDR